MAARNGVWLLAISAIFVLLAIGLTVESLPHAEPAKLSRSMGRSSAAAPFPRFTRSGPTHVDAAINLKVAALNVGPLVPLTVSTTLPDARTFYVDVDLNHDGRFEGAGELAYATGTFDEAGIGELRLHGLIDGRYRARVRADGIHGEAVSAIQRFELSAPRNSHLPMSFEVNKGQSDSSVLFLGRAKNQMVFVTAAETVIRSQGSGVGSQTTNHHSRFRLAGANSWARPTGEKKLPGIVNYFIGNDPSKWHTDIETYQELVTCDVYPGIRMIHRSSQGRLAYDFRVEPGANPADIALDFSDAEHLSLNADGDLLVHHAAGDTIRHGAPLMYQESHGLKQAVKGDWMLKGEKQAAFMIATYDRGRELVIDPLVFSTYFGGTVNDGGNAIAVDAAGNSYVTGTSFSADFPTTVGAFQTAFGGSQDVMVVKLNPAGTAVIYSTYLGAANNDFGTAIAVDGAGNAYVTGQAASAFPTTVGAFQTVYGTNGDAFVAKLNPTGSGLVYSTYLGGSGLDIGHGIAIDAAGNAYVTGETASNDFPTTAGAFKTTFSGGAPDLFIAKLNPTGTALVYSTYMGGSSGGSWDIGFAIAVDAAGNAYVTGESSSSDFQTTPGAFQVALAGGLDAFVVKMNPTGSALVYSTFIGGATGGAANDQGRGIAVDASGNVYVAGGTSCNDFPTTAGAFQTVQAGGADVIVAKLNPAGNALLYATCLGSVGDEWATAIAIDGAGNAYVAGQTNSAGFPTVNPVQALFVGGPSDAFAAIVNPAGAALVFSSYLGGSGIDVANGLAIDATGAIYLTGQTSSTDFPTMIPVQAATGGGQDLFIAKLTTGVGPPPPPPAAGTLFGVTFGGNEIITINTTTGAGTLLGNLSPAMNVIGIGFRGPDLYVYDRLADRMQQLNPATAATLASVDTGAGIAFTEGDIAFRSDGIGFLAGGFAPNFYLYRFDIAGPSSTQLTAALNPVIDGLAFNGAGVLYGLGQGGTDLYTIDQATAATTLVGPTGIAPAAYNLGGLAFDASGNLFAVLTNPGASSLFQINSTTGTGTLIGNIGFTGVSGISFMPAAVVPPPVVPPPTPGGGIDEGDYPGSKGLGNGPGGEGTFGFGRHMTQQARLKGPYRDPVGTLRMLNIAQQQRRPAVEADSSVGLLGWGLMLLAVFVPAALVYGRWRAE